MTKRIGDIIVEQGSAERAEVERAVLVVALRAAFRIASLVARRDQVRVLLSSGLIPFEERMWVLPAESLAGE